MASNYDLEHIFASEKVSRARSLKAAPTDKTGRPVEIDDLLQLPQTGHVYRVMETYESGHTYVSHIDDQSIYKNVLPIQTQCFMHVGKVAWLEQQGKVYLWDSGEWEMARPKKRTGTKPVSRASSNASHSTQIYRFFIQLLVITLLSMLALPFLAFVLAASILCIALELMIDRVEKG